MNINYGINRKQGRRIIHENHKMDLPEFEDSQWDDDEVREAIRQRIVEKHPGWLVTGYALPSLDKDAGETPALQSAGGDARAPRADFKEVPLPPRYCTVCREPVPAERVARHSATCSDECQGRHKREMRAVKAGKTCRLCGRAFRRPRREKDITSASPQGLKQGAPGAQTPLSEAVNRILREGLQ